MYNKYKKEIIILMSIIIMIISGLEIGLGIEMGSKIILIPAIVSLCIFSIVFIVVGIGIISIFMEEH